LLKKRTTSKCYLSNYGNVKKKKVLLPPPQKLEGGYDESAHAGASGLTPVKNLKRITDLQWGRNENKN
jgi:hypothetical protein